MIAFTRVAIVGLTGAFAKGTKTNDAFSDLFTSPSVDEIYVFGLVSPTLAEKDEFWNPGRKLVIHLEKNRQRRFYSQALFLAQQDL